jgi:hypothetical protein
MMAVFCDYASGLIHHVDVPQRHENGGCALDGFMLKF